MTSRTASADASIVITASALLTASAGGPAPSTPSPARGSAFSRVRFQAFVSTPAAARLRAIGPPMIPVPSTATLLTTATVASIPLRSTPNHPLGSPADRARRGGSGALSPAIHSSGAEYPSEGRGLRGQYVVDGVDGQVPRNARPRTRSGPEGSSLKR